MKVMKKLMGMLLVLTMVFAMAACASDDTTTTDPGSDSSEQGDGNGSESGETRVITIWTNNRHDQEYMEAKVAEFNETNTSNIQIDYVIQTDNYMNMLTMASTSGQSPDIMSISASDGIDLQSFVDSNMIQPLTGRYSDTFQEVNEIDSVQYQGLNVLGDEIYWIPTGMRSGSRLIYNAEIFAEAGVEVPTTLDELVTTARTITEAGNGEYYGVIFPGQSGPFGRWLEGVASMSGVTAYDYANGEFNFDGFKPLLEATRQMFDEGSTFPGTTSMKIDPIRAQFAEGNVGIHGNASQEVGVLTEQFPMEQEWGVADLPTYDGEITGALNITPNFGWMVSSTTEDVDAAMEVIEFFGSEDFLKGYLEGGYTLPISSHMDSVIDKSLIGRTADFSLQPYEDVYPTVPSVTPEGEVWSDALWNASTPGGPDIDETIATLNETYNAALDRAVEMGRVQRLVIPDFDPLHPSAGTPEYLSE